MADNEVSKLTWVAIVVALAGSVYGVSKTQIPALASSVFAKVSNLVGTDDTNNAGSETAPVAEKPDSNDAKWVEKGNYGDNGYFVRDADGNGIVYSLDNAKPILAPNGGSAFTKGSWALKTLKFLNKTILPVNASSYFTNNSSLTSFSSQNLDTSQVTNMSGMFDNNPSLTTLDVSNLNTSKVTHV